MIDLTSQKVLPTKKDLIPDLSEFPFGRQKGYELTPNSIFNNRIQRKNRTYDAIVDAGGQGDFTTIETAVSYVNALGGGDIFVWGGTYTPISVMTITTPINIVGQNSALAIINFNSTANDFVGNSGTAYTTGTITVISGTAVTGSGSLWSANVTAGQYIFLRSKWYVIASVTDNTHLVLGEAYDENFVTLPSTYRIATLTRSVMFEGLTIKNSTGTGIAVTDCRDFFLNDVVFLTNNKGFVLNNVSNVGIDLTISASNTSNGYELNNCGQLSIRGLASVGNSGHNGVLNVVEVGSIQASNASAAIGATSDGLNVTSAADVDLNVICNSNGRIGVNLVSGNNNVIMKCVARNNVSDGIKLTATSDYCKIVDGHFDTNGGYGINIAASTCDKNVVDGNSYNANVSGTLNDLGTGTVNGNNTT